ncbi:MAG: DUF1801 domain-containing protein [Oscillospiraceae bacterium]|jgi:uncharacterized protein YdhG (YjbR/CyaY superfamily)|nr:DUF1801 domain-containing protein [Oscillospiraceae bacterium]
MWKCPACGRDFKKEGQHHFCGEINSVEDYIADQTEAVRPLLERVRETIRAAAPDATEKLAWGMPTFWQGANLIHFAACNKHIGLYPGGEASAALAQRLEGYKTTKGSIHLPLDKPIDYQLITDVVRWKLDRLNEQ